MNESCHTHERVMSHTWTSHVTHMNESCHTHERVMSHTWTSHVTHMNESCHTHECIISHTWTRLLIYTWIMSHVWTSHPTLTNESVTGMEEDSDGNIIPSLTNSQARTGGLLYPGIFFFPFPASFTWSAYMCVWIMSHTNVSYHVSISHVTYKSHMYTPYLLSRTRVTYKSHMYPWYLLSRRSCHICIHHTFSHELAALH